MDSKSPKFGDVLHKNVSHDSVPFKIPSGFDPHLLGQPKTHDFLSDDVKAILGIPLSHKPHMALVDDVVFTTYLQKMEETAQKLDELMMTYEDIDNSLPGQGKDHLRATVQNSLLLASRLKTSPLHHLTLAGLSRWLKQQKLEMEKTQESLDDFASDVRQMEEEAAAAKEAEEQQKAALAAEAECARVEGLEAAQQGSSGDLRTSHDGGETQKDGGQSYKMSTKEKQAQKMSVHSAAIAASVVVGHKEDKGRTSTFPAPDPVRENSDSQLGASHSQLGVSPKGKNDADAHSTDLKELKQLRGTVQSQTQQLTQRAAQLKAAEKDIDQANATIEELKQQLQQLNPSLNLNSPDKSRKGGGARKSKTGGVTPTSPAMPQFPGASSALQGDMESTVGPTAGAHLSVAVPPSPGYQESPASVQRSVTGFAEKQSPSIANMTSPAPRSMMSPQDASVHSSSTFASPAYANTPATALATPATEVLRSSDQNGITPQSQAHTDSVADRGQGNTSYPSPSGPPALTPPASTTVAKAKKKSGKSNKGERKQSMGITSKAQGDENGPHGTGADHASWVELDGGSGDEGTGLDDADFPEQQDDDRQASTHNGHHIEPPTVHGVHTEVSHVSETQNMPDDDKLREEVKRLRAERRAQDSQISRLEQEVREMTHALGQTIATVEGAAGRSGRGSERHSVKTPRSRVGSVHGAQNLGEEDYDEDDEDLGNSVSQRLQQKCGHVKSKRGRSAHSKEADLAKYTEDPKEEDLPEGVLHSMRAAQMQSTDLEQLVRSESRQIHQPRWKSCPRCSELERQLQYWRKKSWYQKARNARWDKLKANREEIVVNVDSKFTGLVIEKEAKAAASSTPFGFGADQLQAGGLGSKRAATNPQSTTDRSPTQRVRASRSTPGMMNVSKKADASSTAPSELQYLAPIGQGVGANEAGGLDDTGTMHSVAYFTPASAALKRSHKGQSSAVLRQGHLRANEVRGGEHGADHAQPFALRESLAKLLHCRSKDHPEGVPAQVGESAHRDRSHAHGEGGRLMFGGEVQLGGRSVSPARMLQEIQGRRAQHSTHHSQADELDADSLKLFSHLSAGVIPPASLPGTAGSGRARADNPSHVSAGERGSSQAPGMQIIEKVWASDKSTTQETSKQVQHPQGRSQADSTIDSTRHAAAERKVDLLRQNQRSREPATVPSLRGKACGKDSSSNKIQESKNPVDHVTIMLEEKGTVMKKIATAAPPKTLQTAPKKGGLRSAIVSQQTRLSADQDGQKRGSFSVKGQRPPRRD